MKKVFVFVFLILSPGFVFADDSSPAFSLRGSARLGFGNSNDGNGDWYYNSAIGDAELRLRHLLWTPVVLQADALWEEGRDGNVYGRRMLAASIGLAGDALYGYIDPVEYVWYLEAQGGLVVIREFSQDAIAPQLSLRQELHNPENTVRISALERLTFFNNETEWFVRGAVMAHVLEFWGITFGVDVNQRKFAFPEKDNIKSTFEACIDTYWFDDELQLSFCGGGEFYSDAPNGRQSEWVFGVNGAWLKW